MGTLDNYFSVAIAQQIERGQRLLSRIPKSNELPREMYTLAQTCELKLKDSLQRLSQLKNNPYMEKNKYQPVRLRKLRRIVANMSHLETIGITVLERSHRNDVFLNRLVESICREIHYPILPPVISSLSQGYYHIYCDLHLLFVPLGESDFLLHLPDLYHELAHPLLAKQNDSRVVSFQDAFYRAYGTVMQHLFDEKQKAGRRNSRNSGTLLFTLDRWEESWGDWLIEFFCDLFATCTVGPAFVWSHLHLFAKMGQNPFYVPTVTVSTHPADDARMKLMLQCLSRLGFSEDAKNILGKWEHLITISGTAAEPEYSLCFPVNLLQTITDEAVKGVMEMGCNITDPNNLGDTSQILKDAWDNIWNNSNGFISWEREAIQRLQQYYDYEKVRV